MIKPTLSTYFITQGSGSHTNICHSLIQKLETYSVATSLETQNTLYMKNPAKKQDALHVACFMLVSYLAYSST
jgi:hypothetical protein